MTCNDSQLDISAYGLCLSLPASLPPFKLLPPFLGTCDPCATSSRERNSLCGFAPSIHSTWAQSLRASSRPPLRHLLSACPALSSPRCLSRANQRWR
ncbi:hypothetical protein OE88DRAFT_1014506 [Heliocybe sulcata]|uniref:Uncharacterized protein n=1 Tax=Heliocybe sulcata TaxID=5364 RepID=A0A5C3ND09_9AGAM|nr:hypothetical protein OE88DRAFT_1014506 [Heliocybe sulcata]